MHFRFVLKTICRLCDVSAAEDLSLETQGIWVPSFNCISYVNVYVVLVCGHPYDLRSLCPDGCCYMCMLWLIF